ncbi:MAG: hypothetical protein EOP51_20930, partial [Sphingobacteriales bacterium]
MKPLTGTLAKNLLILHFTVFIWGFTGILGALITVPALQLVWYRVIIAVVTLLIYFIATNINFRVNKRSLLTLVFTGAIVGGHWILFFAAIKLSTVSVTLVCLSSMTLFTAVLEPLLGKKQISKLEIVAGLLIITGIMVIFKFETQYTKGIICGLFSALLASIFSIINSYQVKKHEAPVVAFYELSGVFIWISLYLLITGGFNASLLISTTDLGYLMVLGTICTAVAYVAGVSVMRELSAFRVALVTNLEPVYGIVLAFIFLGDMQKMTGGFWVGAAILLSTIFLFPVAKKRVCLNNCALMPRYSSGTDAMRPANLILRGSKYHYTDEQGLIDVYFGERATVPQKSASAHAPIAFDPATLVTTTSVAPTLQVGVPSTILVGGTITGDEIDAYGINLVAGQTY